MVKVPRGCIAYLRVSTNKQGVSGLGLAAQREAVRLWAAAQGTRVAAEYRETESGKVSARPELARALAHAKRTGCVLVVAKLDRLARDTRFVLEVLDSGAAIAFCDMPDMQGPQARLMLTQFSAFAEYEAALISQRTKAALAAAKARGVKLGNPKGAAPLLRYHARRRARGEPLPGTIAAQHAAFERVADMQPLLRELAAEGFTSRRAIADELNERGVQAPRGGKWHPTGVSRLLAKAQP